MSYRKWLICLGVLGASGCLYHAREHTDATVAQLVGHPYDVSPEQLQASESQPAPGGQAPSSRPEMGPAPAPAPPKAPAAGEERSQTDPAPARKTDGEIAAYDVQTTAFMQQADQLPETGPQKPKFEPKIPPGLPGAESPPIRLPPHTQEEARKQAIKELFPELAPLPLEPQALPGPEGRPLTLADLQQVAAANSPELRQAAADVESARGNLIQARAYPNPTIGWIAGPSNDNSTPGFWGPFADQIIKTGGKLKLSSASAEMDLRNAELALRRARNDLATRVRNAYYAHLVAKETVRVNRALAEFSDQIYRLQTGLMEAGQAASYEPMALRAQAWTIRLAHKQSIQSFIYSWKQLVAAIGRRQMPLTQVQGRIDTLIPRYDYDRVLGYVLRNHTDVLAARNGIDKARYQLKLAQATPIPDVDVNVALQNEFVVAPKQFAPTLSIGLPLFPIWDQNKGNIMAAEGGLIRATEEPHRVELNLTNLLSATYTTYKNNLEAIEYYRHHILPDQVRTYRGILERRQIDPTANFSDLFNAQQTLATEVTGYLQVLGTLWSSVVSVADLLQTDDLFQLAEAQQIPELPDLEHLAPWPCCHPGAGIGEATGSGNVPLPAPLVAPPQAFSPSPLTQQSLAQPQGLAPQQWPARQTLASTASPSPPASGTPVASFATPRTVAPFSSRPISAEPTHPVWASPMSASQLPQPALRPSPSAQFQPGSIAVPQSMSPAASTIGPSAAPFGTSEVQPLFSQRAGAPDLPNEDAPIEAPSPRRNSRAEVPPLLDSDALPGDPRGGQWPVDRREAQPAAAPITGDRPGE